MDKNNQKQSPKKKSKQNTKKSANSISSSSSSIKSDKSSNPSTFNLSTFTTSPIITNPTHNYLTTSITASADKGSGSSGEAGGGKGGGVREAEGAGGLSAIQFSSSTRSAATQQQQQQQQQQQPTSNLTSPPQFELKLVKQLNATRQIGGKGTIRRRRLRHKTILQSADSLHNKSEQMRSFLNKFEFADLGQMERITLISDTGKLTSYDGVNVHSNWKNGMFYLNLTKYHQQRHSTSGRKMTSSSTNKLDDASMSSIESQSAVSASASASTANTKSASTLKAGMKIDSAEDLLSTLNYIDEQEDIFRKQISSNENQIILQKLDGFRTQIREIVGTWDAHAYLNRIIRRSQLKQQQQQQQQQQQHTKATSSSSSLQNSLNQQQSSFSSTSNFDKQSLLRITTATVASAGAEEDEDSFADYIPQLMDTTDFETHLHLLDSSKDDDVSELEQEPTIYVNLIEEKTTDELSVIDSYNHETLVRSSITEKSVQVDMQQDTSTSTSPSTSTCILIQTEPKQTLVIPNKLALQVEAMDAIIEQEEPSPSAFMAANSLLIEMNEHDDDDENVNNDEIISISNRKRKKRKSTRLESDPGLARLKPADSAFKAATDEFNFNQIVTDTDLVSNKKLKQQQLFERNVAHTNRSESESYNVSSPQLYKSKSKSSASLPSSSSLNELENQLPITVQSGSISSSSNASSSSGIASMQSFSTLPYTSSLHSIDSSMSSSSTTNATHKTRQKQKLKSHTEVIQSKAITLLKQQEQNQQHTMSSATSGTSLSSSQCGESSANDFTMSTSISGGLQSSLAGSEFSSITSINNASGVANEEFSLLIKSSRPRRPITKSLTERIELRKYQDELIIHHPSSTLISAPPQQLTVNEQEMAMLILSAEQQIESIDSHATLIPHPTSSRKSKNKKKLKKKPVLTNDQDQDQQQEQQKQDSLALCFDLVDDDQVVFSEKELNLINTFTSSVSSSSLDLDNTNAAANELIKSIAGFHENVKTSDSFRYSSTSSSSSSSPDANNITIVASLTTSTTPTTPCNPCKITQEQSENETSNQQQKQITIDEKLNLQLSSSILLEIDENNETSINRKKNLIDPIEQEEQEKQVELNEEEEDSTSSSSSSEANSSSSLFIVEQDTNNKSEEKSIELVIYDNTTTAEDKTSATTEQSIAFNYKNMSNNAKKKEDNAEASDSDDSINYHETEPQPQAQQQSISPFTLVEDEPAYHIQSSSSFVLKLTTQKPTTSPDDSSPDQVDLFLKDYDFLDISSELAQQSQHESKSESSFKEQEQQDATLSQTVSVDEQLKQIEQITNQSLNKYFDMKIVDDLNSKQFTFAPSIYSSSDENLTLKETVSVPVAENGKDLFSNNMSASFHQQPKTSEEKVETSNEFYVAQINELNMYETGFAESTENICKYILPASSRIDSPKHRYHYQQNQQQQQQNQQQQQGGLGQSNSITSSIITSSIDPGSPILTRSALRDTLGDSMYSSNFSTCSSKNNDDTYDLDFNMINTNLNENNENSSSSPVKHITELSDAASRKTKHSKLLSRELKQDKILAYKENKTSTQQQKLTKESFMLENEMEAACIREMKEKDCVKIIKNLDELKKSIEEETDTIEQDMLELINLERENKSLVARQGEIIVINRVDLNKCTEKPSINNKREGLNQFDNVVGSFISFESNSKKLNCTEDQEAFKNFGKIFDTYIAENNQQNECDSETALNQYNKIVNSFIGATHHDNEDNYDKQEDIELVEQSIFGEEIQKKGPSSETLNKKNEFEKIIDSFMAETRQQNDCKIEAKFNLYEQIDQVLDNPNNLVIKKIEQSGENLLENRKIPDAEIFKEDIKLNQMFVNEFKKLTNNFIDYAKQENTSIIDENKIKAEAINQFREIVHPISNNNDDTLTEHIRTFEKVKSLAKIENFFENKSENESRKEPEIDINRSSTKNNLLNIENDKQSEICKKTYKFELETFEKTNLSTHSKVISYKGQDENETTNEKLGNLNNISKETFDEKLNSKKDKNIKESEDNLENLEINEEIINQFTQFTEKFIDDDDQFQYANNDIKESYKQENAESASQEINKDSNEENNYKLKEEKENKTTQYKIVESFIGTRPLSSVIENVDEELYEQEEIEKRTQKLKSNLLQITAEQLLLTIDSFIQSKPSDEETTETKQESVIVEAEKESIQDKDQVQIKTITIPSSYVLFEFHKNINSFLQQEAVVAVVKVSENCNDFKQDAAVLDEVNSDQLLDKMIDSFVFSSASFVEPEISASEKVASLNVSFLEDDYVLQTNNENHLSPLNSKSYNEIDNIVETFIGCFESKNQNQNTIIPEIENNVEQNFYFKTDNIDQNDFKKLFGVHSNIDLIVDNINQDESNFQNMDDKVINEEKISSTPVDTIEIIDKFNDLIDSYIVADSDGKELKLSKANENEEINSKNSEFLLNNDILMTEFAQLIESYIDSESVEVESKEIVTEEFEKAKTEKIIESLEYQTQIFIDNEAAKGLNTELSKEDIVMNEENDSEMQKEKEVKDVPENYYLEKLIVSNQEIDDSNEVSVEMTDSLLKNGEIEQVEELEENKQLDKFEIVDVQDYVQNAKENMNTTDLLFEILNESNKSLDTKDKEDYVTYDHKDAFESNLSKTNFELPEFVVVSDDSSDFREPLVLDSQKNIQAEMFDSSECEEMFPELTKISESFSNMSSTENKLVTEDDFVFIKIIDETKQSEPINIQTDVKKDDVDIKIDISPNYYKKTNPFYEDFNRNTQKAVRANQETFYLSNKSQVLHDVNQKSFVSSNYSRQNLVSNYSSIYDQQMSSSKSIIIHSDNKKDTDFEIPIEISKEPQSKLNNLTQKLNLNLDSLVSREEQLFEIENNASKKKLEEKSSFQAHADSVQNSIRFFNEKSAPTKKSPTLPPRKPTRQKPATDSPPQPEGFDLIKVSIVNKRPVSPDIEDILNGVDEEHYLDKSFVFQDELIKQIEEETKRLSSLDPSIAQEYDCGSSVRSGSVYSKEKYPFATTYSSSSIRAAVTPATGEALNPTNPFANDLIQKNIDDSKSHSLQEQIQNKPQQQLINVDNLTSTGSSNYNLKYEIESNIDKEGIIKVKDISVIGLSVPANSTTNVTSTTKVVLTDPDSQRQKSKTLGHLTNSSQQPHVVEHLFHSEEHLFKGDLKEIQQVSSKTIRTTKTAESKSSQEKGIISVFTRIFEVIRSPFSKNSDKSKKKTTATDPLKHKQKDYRQSLLSGIEDTEIYEDDGLNEEIFTITTEKPSTAAPSDPTSKNLPWEKIKESSIRIQSSSSKIQTQKDVSPKEVAKMRKTMDGKKPWKCCLF